MAELTFADGVLFFPVTPFDDADRLDEAALTAHVDTGVSAGAGGVFAACGTGEFHALSLPEVGRAVTAAVEGAASRVPVLAGAGGPLGHARDVAAAAQDAGADGLLVLPPYLVTGSQAGIVAYVEAVTAASDLPVIVYHRANAQLSEESVARLVDHERVVGIKDGVGDIALAQRFVRVAERAQRDTLFFNGLLTAELSQVAYRAIGVPLYSSAVFAMAPNIANAWFDAYRTGDEPRRAQLLDEFYTPLVRLRDETPGFAVSLIKAGLRNAGAPVGSVRPPLTDPTPQQEARLRALLEHGERLAAEHGANERDTTSQSARDGGV